MAAMAESKRNHDIKKVVYYVLGAYLVSTCFALPLMLGMLQEGTLYKLLIGLATFGPFFSAVGVTYLFEGLAGLKKLFKRWFAWKFPVHIYILVLLFPALFMIFSMFISEQLFGIQIATWFYIPATVITAIVSPLGEEIGWRGFFTTRMLSYLSPIKLSLLLGVIWAVWHYWFYLLPGSFSNNVPFYIFLLSCIGQSMLLTWFLIQGKGTIFVCVLYHMAFNLSFNVVNVRNDLEFSPLLVMAILEVVVGLILCLSIQKRNNIHSVAESF